MKAMILVPWMACPEGESMKPMRRDGGCKKRHTDGDQASYQEKESPVVQIVDVVHEAFHKGWSQVRQVWSTGGQEKAKFEAEPEHPKGKSNHEAPKGSRLVCARPEDPE